MDEKHDCPRGDWDDCPCFDEYDKKLAEADALVSILRKQLHSEEARLAAATERERKAADAYCESMMKKCDENADLRARLAAAEGHAIYLQSVADERWGWLERDKARIASLEEIARTAERWCYDCSGGGTRREVLEKLREARKPC
jgi:hypothetical protein